MADHRHTTFFDQRCEALSRQAKARVLAIGRPRNCNNKCVSGGQRTEWTAAIELNVSKCCTISSWHSNDSNPKKRTLTSKLLRILAVEKPCYNFHNRWPLFILQWYYNLWNFPVNLSLNVIWIIKYCGNTYTYAVNNLTDAYSSLLNAYLKVYIISNRCLF